MEKIDQSISHDGLVTTTFVDDEGRMHVDYKQDATASGEAVQRARNDGEAWRKGVKAGFVHAFHIPSGVVHELLKVGVNVYTSPMKDIVWGLKRINRFEMCDNTGKTLA